MEGIKSTRTAKLPRRPARPPSTCVSEGAWLLETEKPSDPRNRHALLLQIADRQTRLELLKDIDKSHALLGKPTLQRSRAHAELLGHDAHLCLAVGKQWGDGILDRGAEKRCCCSCEPSGFLRRL